MEHVVLVIHLILTLALIVLILLQRSEGGGLGIGGGGGGMGGLATPQATANVLTKATTIVAMCFFATSLILAISASRGGAQPTSILDAVVDNPPAASSSASPGDTNTGINSESAPAAPAASSDAPKTEAKPKTAPAVPIAE
jgi:preprotein translocase subunit SecG